ncbi:hypothetical protein [Sphingobium sp. KCTC 72723]|uniref:hypothetical protein n=1 Tax=Sphingobium sp. KCTC 72723 TaxID=2733867 RepID=UPI00165E20D4|nr:hypothetical protein [Sphingobium sp. KCTC 72723]
MDEDEAVETMVGWFHENYEDPAQETPYESAEGGYQYIWGGPYDAEEEISGAFPDAPEDLISRAIEEVQSDGLYDWAPNGRRIQEVEPDEEEEEEPDVDLSERLNALGAQLDRIEQHIAYWRDRPAGMGHNAPPTEFQITPEDSDLVEAAESVAEVRAELAKQDRETQADLEVVQRAESRFKKLADRIRSFFKWSAVTVGAFAAEYVATKAIDYAAENPEAFYAALQGAGKTLAHWSLSLIGMF